MRLDKITQLINEVLSKQEYKKILPKLKLGIELEVVNSEWDTKGDAIDKFDRYIGTGSYSKLKNLFGSYKLSKKYHGSKTYSQWRIEPDGSLPRNGLEIISPVLSYEDFITKIPVIVQELTKLGFHGSKDTGLHLNISSDEIDINNKIKDDFLFYQKYYSGFFSAILTTDRESKGLFHAGDINRESSSYSKSLANRLKLDTDLLGIKGDISDYQEVKLNLDDIMHKEIVGVDKFDSDRTATSFANYLKDSHASSVALKDKYIELRGLGGEEGFKKISTKDGINNVVLMAVSQLFRPRKKVSNKEAYRLVQPYIKILSDNLKTNIVISNVEGITKGTLTPEQIARYLNDGEGYKLLTKDIEITPALLHKIIETMKIGKHFSSMIDNVETSVIIKTIAEYLKDGTDARTIYRYIVLLGEVAGNEEYKNLINAKKEFIFNLVREDARNISLFSKELVVALNPIPEDIQIIIAEDNKTLLNYIDNLNPSILSKLFKDDPSKVFDFPSASEEDFIRGVDNIKNYYEVITYSFPYKPKAFKYFLDSIIQENKSPMYLTEFKDIDPRLLVEFAKQYPVLIYSYVAEHLNKIPEEYRTQLIDIMNNDSSVKNSVIAHAGDIYYFERLSPMITNLTSKEAVGILYALEPNRQLEILNSGVINADDLANLLDRQYGSGSGRLSHRFTKNMNTKIMQDALTIIFPKYPLQILRDYIKESPDAKYTFRALTSYMSWLKKYIPKGIQAIIKNDTNIQNIILQNRFFLNSNNHPYGLTPVMQFAGWDISDITNYKDN